MGNLECDFAVRDGGDAARYSAGRLSPAFAAGHPEGDIMHHGADGDSKLIVCERRSWAAPVTAAEGHIFERRRGVLEWLVCDDELQ